MEKYWMGDEPNCDLCKTKATNLKEFVDGKTRMGPWANMCMLCFTTYGVGLGMGLGQQYRKQKDGKWLKVRG